MPYPGLDPCGVIELVDCGGRLDKPKNSACSDEMWVTWTMILSYTW